MHASCCRHVRSRFTSRREKSTAKTLSKSKRSSVNMSFIPRVFSGIQPTGIPHLGNYFGAISHWLNFSRNTNTTPILSIVDVHAYTSPGIQYGPKLYQNIMDTTASLLSLGLNQKNCILFRQSDIHEHNYLDNVLHNFVSTRRLLRMTQYKEKTSQTPKSKMLPSGLLTYPVLQAADILLYKATLVPVGDDQEQHVELTREIARRFNAVTSSDMFPEPSTLLPESEHARRIKSLRDPRKKMSKSDANKNSFIQVVDEPDVLREKLKKALTDSVSEVYYDAQGRPGVSNLIRLHHLATGESFEQIRNSCRGMETAQHKLHLADILIEKFRPAREEFKRIRMDRAYLESILKQGHDKAKPLAMETISQVKNLLGSLNDSGNMT